MESLAYIDNNREQLHEAFIRRWDDAWISEAAPSLLLCYNVYIVDFSFFSYFFFFFFKSVEYVGIMARNKRNYRSAKGMRETIVILCSKENHVRKTEVV